MKINNFKQLLKKINWKEEYERDCHLYFGNEYAGFVREFNHDNKNWFYATYKALGYEEEEEFDNKLKAKLWIENNFINQLKKYFK